jgi:imidazolonepropionase
VSVLVVDRIGLLVTGEPSLGEGPLGLVRDAALVVDGGRLVGFLSVTDLARALELRQLRRRAA